jgi:hypothetical protein
VTPTDPRVERALRAFFEEADDGPFFMDDDDFKPENGQRGHEVWATMDTFRKAMTAAIEAATDE